MQYSTLNKTLAQKGRESGGGCKCPAKGLFVHNEPTSRLYVENAFLNKGINLSYQDLYDLARNLISYRVTIFEGLDKTLIQEPSILRNFENIGNYGNIEWVDLLVLEQACKDALAWNDGCTVAVNISSNNFHHHNILNDVTQIIDRTGLPPRQLELEITERRIVEADITVKSQLTRLADLGVRLAFKGFRSSQSNLQNLWDIPFTRVKIDGAFIQAASDGRHWHQIVWAMSNLARHGHINLVAENIENEQQLVLAQQAGCTLVQGNFFSLPRSQENVLNDIQAGIKTQAKAGIKIESTAAKKSSSANLSDNLNANLRPAIAHAEDVGGGIVTLPLQFIDDITSSTCLADIMAATSKWVSAILPADQAIIALSKGEAEKGEECALMPIDGASFQCPPLPILSTMAGRVYQSRMGEICADLHGSPDDDAQILAQAGCASSITVPLCSNNICLGIMTLAQANGRYTKEDQRHLQSLSNWLATQIHLQFKLNEAAAPVPAPVTAPVTSPVAITDIDAMTGVLTRKAFLQEIENTHEETSPLSIVLADIDNLALINRTFGQSTGDLAVVKIANILSEICHNNGHIIGRIGGDEFAIIIKNAKDSSADHLFDQLKRQIESNPLIIGNHPINLKVSFGAAYSSNTNVESLYNQADSALWEVKGRGGDRCLSRNL